MTKIKFTIAVYYDDYKKLKKVFPPMKNETLCNWFHRLQVVINDYNEDIKNLK